MVTNRYQAYIYLGLLPIQLVPGYEAHLIQIFDRKDRDVGVIAAEDERNVFQLNAQYRTVRFLI